MKMNFVNLTPHPVSVLTCESDTAPLVLPSQGVARVAVISTPGAPLGGYPTDQVSYSSEVQGLPEPVEGTTYVVSLITLQALPVGVRQDVVAPGKLVRDASGNITGCVGFTIKS
jgi:hypothetical protein